MRRGKISLEEGRVRLDASQFLRCILYLKGPDSHFLTAYLCFPILISTKWHFVGHLLDLTQAPGHESRNAKA